MNDEKAMVTANLPTVDVLDRVDRIARIAATSGLTTYRKTESAAMVLLTGRELGLGPMASLRGIHDVNGKPVLAADLMVAVVRRSGLCKTWRVVESTATRCEIVTRRVGEEHDESCVWTMDDARRAGCGGATWQKFPRQMLSHRCAAELARRVFSDVLLGLYTPDELGGEAPPPDDDRAPIDAQPQPQPRTVDVITVPRDNGLSPSGAPLPDAPAAPSALTEREHAAMLAMIAAAPDAAALKASLAEIADDVRRGTDEQRKTLRAAANARFAALTPPPANDGDEPPPGDGPKPRGGRRSAPKGDASADAPAAPQGAPAAPQDGAAAWLLSLDATPAAVAAVEAHLATKRSKPEVENSARKHGAALGARPWALRLYGERLAAIVAGDADMCTRNVTAWAAAGSQAAAQRRAA